MSDMGTFRINIEIENPVLPGRRGVLPFVLVDTGSELSWVQHPFSNHSASSASNSRASEKRVGRFSSVGSARHGSTRPEHSLPTTSSSESPAT